MIQKKDDLFYPSYLDDIKKQILTPLLNYCPPKTLKKILKKIGFEEITEFEDPTYAGSYKSIQKIMDNEKQLNFGQKLYYHSPPAKAIHNRYRIHKELIKENLTNCYHPNTILDLGAGNGRLEIESISDLKRNGVNLPLLKVICVDGNKDSVNDGNQLAQDYSLQKNFCFIHDFIDFSKIPKLDKYYRISSNYFNQTLDNHELSITIGLAEYLQIGSPEKSNILNLYSSLYQNQTKGKIITSFPKKHSLVNVCEKTFGWKCDYKEPDELEKILQKVGYKNVHHIPEPYHLQHIFVAEKK